MRFHGDFGRMKIEKNHDCAKFTHHKKICKNAGIRKERMVTDFFDDSDDDILSEVAEQCKHISLV